MPHFQVDSIILLWIIRIVLGMEEYKYLLGLITKHDNTCWAGSFLKYAILISCVITSKAKESIK